MPDIGLVFTPMDIVLAVLIGCAPGLVLGAALGAWKNPGHRFRAAVLWGAIGFILAFAGWWVYLTVIK
ncbi:hypothetical protein [Hoeflea olei]|uniref:hypothetical protein n=1 Tax=Hoeflea olei TaxID=1480615 RepID=UPI0011120793|nr:hypothetical protein [Hoeflea olei]